MEKKCIIDAPLLDIILRRLCQELTEKHGVFENSVILGLQKGGVCLAQRLQHHLSSALKAEVPTGFLDVTFYRDDFRRRETPLQANKTQVPFVLEKKKVILVDDVLYTGRTVRAALDAMLAFGRPAAVELLVLVNRRYSRHLPIEPNYTGHEVNTLASQHVSVEWQENGDGQDGVWLLDKAD